MNKTEEDEMEREVMGVEGKTIRVIEVSNALCEDEKTVSNSLLNYDDEIVTGGGFYIAYEMYFKDKSKKFHHNDGNKSVKVGEVINIINRRIHEAYYGVVKNDECVKHCVRFMSYHQNTRTFWWIHK